MSKPTSSAEDDSWSAGEIRHFRQRQVALGYRILAAQRWGDLGDGHVSARDPERTDCFWFLRYGVPYNKATIADLVLIDPQGQLVEGQGPINPAAYYIHTPLLAARPDVISACHVHTGWGTPFSSEMRPVEPITQEACIFFEDHSLFDDEEVQIQSVEAGARIAKALGTNRAVILRNHGILTVGENVSDAVGCFVTLERVCEAHMKAPNAKPISAEAARFAKQDLIRFGPGRLGFHMLVARHVGDPSIVG